MQTELNRINKRPSKPKKGWKIFIWIIVIFIFLGVGFAGAAWWKFNGVLDKVSVANEPEILQGDRDKAKAYNHEPISFVLLGKDSRGNLDLLNTDVIVVAVLNPSTKHVTMMSIPRDTGVQIPGYKGWYKINSVYARGEEQRKQEEKSGKPIDETGIHLMKETLEGALGIPIQHYVTVDFQGFERVIDKLGGISIQVEKSMKYDDPADGTHIDLNPGVQLLNGEQALGYVRHRKDNRGPKYYSSDFDRGNRQQTVIKAVVDKMKSFSGISSFFGVMDVAGDHIRTDLSKEQMEGLIMDFKSVGSENMTSIHSDGYWDPISTHTIIPSGSVAKIQQAFRREMGLSDAVVDSTFREIPAKSIPVKKTKPTDQEEEALKVQLEEKKNEQVNIEKAQPAKPAEKATTKPKDNLKPTVPPSMPNQKTNEQQPSQPTNPVPTETIPIETKPPATTGEVKPREQPVQIQPPVIKQSVPTKDTTPTGG